MHVTLRSGRGSRDAILYSDHQQLHVCLACPVGDLEPRILLVLKDCLGASRSAWKTPASLAQPHTLLHYCPGRFVSLLFCRLGRLPFLFLFVSSVSPFFLAISARIHPNDSSISSFLLRGFENAFRPMTADHDESTAIADC